MNDTPPANEPSPRPPGGPYRPLIERTARHSIRGKLITVTLTITVAALSMSSAVLMAYYGFASLQRMVHSLRTTANVVALNAAPAVLFKDAEEAGKVLSSFSADRHILYAFLMLPDHQLLAGYHPGASPGHTHGVPAWDQPLSYSLQSVEMRLPVKVGAETVAHLVVQRSLLDLWWQLAATLGAVLLAASLGILMAYLLSSRLQKVISEPILDLAITARRVSQTKDFSIRAVPRTEDETAILLQYFNEMLEQIQQRDGELRAAHDGLETRVQERTAELEREIEERKRVELKIKTLLWRIHEDNEKLMQLDRLKNDFLSTISHELRTPLTAILGFLKLMDGGQAGPLTDTQTDFVQTSLSNANRLYLLVNDLLDMTRLESGIVTLQPKTMDAEGTLREIVKSVQNLADAKKIRITLNVPEKTLQFQADPEKFQRVLLNLLSNAIKFTPEAGEIEAGARATEHGDSKGVTFWVKDSGIGIPKGELKRIFDKFYQVESSATRRAGGTGLGLAIAKHIVSAHGGDIWADSPGEKGSTFYCFIPRELPSLTA